MEKLEPIVFNVPGDVAEGVIALCQHLDVSPSQLLTELVLGSLESEGLSLDQS
jgi:hypothetical protein